MEQILTERQRQALKLVGEEPGLSHFYLTGGTALAGFYLHHRYSDDLDFFIDGEVDDLFVRCFVDRLARELGSQSVRQERLHDRRLFFLKFADGDLKVEFSRYPFKQLVDVELRDGVRLDSLRDITANKLAAMLDRFDPKDFVDLYFLLQNRSLVGVKADAEQKFRMTIEPLFLGSELMKVKRIEALPRLIAPLAVETLQAFFFTLAKGLNREVIEE